MSIIQATINKVHTLVSISNRSGTDSHLTFSPTTASASCSFQLNADGTCRIENLRQVDQNFGNWLLSGAAADYEARVTLVSGTLSSGSGAGAWLALSANRAWTVAVSQTFVGSTFKDCTFTVEIRLASSGAVLDTATVDIHATAEMA